MGKITCNARSHVNLRTFSDFESGRLNSLKILFNAFNYDYSPTSSLHTPDVDLPGVVGKIPEEMLSLIHWAAVRRPLLGVVHELLRKILTFPTSPPSAVSGRSLAQRSAQGKSHQSFLRSLWSPPRYSSQFSVDPELRLQHWQTANKLGTGQSFPSGTQKVKMGGFAKVEI